MWSTSSCGVGALPSKIITIATCMCALEWSSRCRNVESSAVRRSGLAIWFDCRRSSGPRQRGRMDARFEQRGGDQVHVNVDGWMPGSNSGVVIKRLESTPKDATHWSTWSMAREVGMTSDAVMRIWHAFGLQPHRQETWKLSEDPLFIEKVHDICGLYLNPPERAVVLCVNEKSQIQALDRTTPILPGTPQRRRPRRVPRTQGHLSRNRMEPRHEQGPSRTADFR